jgi:curved DNA-binding protein CbpA
MKDYYDVLQVSPDAEPEVVEAAYKRLARKYHPDVNRDAMAAGRMRELNEAYEVLSDCGRRAEYDTALGRAWARAEARRRHESSTSPSQNQHEPTGPESSPAGVPAKAKEPLWSVILGVASVVLIGAGTAAVIAAAIGWVLYQF